MVQHLEQKIGYSTLLVLDDLYLADERLKSQVDSIVEVTNSSVRAILVTTRDKNTAWRFTPSNNWIEIPAMSFEQSKSLLLGHLATNLISDTSNSQGMIDLIASLEGLPLAITLAAKYMSLNNITIDVYLFWWRDATRRARLLGQNEVGAQAPLFDRISTTERAIRRQSERAQKLLLLMAIFHDNPVPELLLKDKDEDTLDFVEAMGLLQSAFLVSKVGGEACYTLHIIVKSVIRNELQATGNLHVFQELLLKRLMEHFPDQPSTLSEKLFPHAQVATEYSYSTDTLQLQCASLLQRMIVYALTCDRFVTLREMCEKSLQIRENTLGLDHLSTLESRSVLAVALQALGDFVRAQDLHEVVLSATERLLGRDHPLYLRRLRSKVVLYTDLIDYGYRPELLKETFWLSKLMLKLGLKILGDSHREFIMIQNDYANVLFLQAQFDAAKQHAEEALARSQTVFGYETVNSISIMRTLARIGLAYGTKDRSIAFLEKAFAIAAKLPGILTKVMIIGDLAYGRESHDQLEFALSMYYKALQSARDRNLDEIPGVLRIASRQALLLLRLGKTAEAALLHGKTIAVWCRLLGPTCAVASKLKQEFAKQRELTEHGSLRKLATEFVSNSVIATSEQDPVNKSPSMPIVSKQPELTKYSSEQEPATKPSPALEQVMSKQSLANKPPTPPIELEQSALSAWPSRTSPKSSVSSSRSQTNLVDPSIFEPSKASSLTTQPTTIATRATIQRTKKTSKRPDIHTPHRATINDDIVRHAVADSRYNQ